LTRLAADLRVAVALARRSLKQAFRRPQFLAPIVVFPSLLLAVNTGGAGSAVRVPGFPAVHGFLDFQLAGAMLQSAMLASIGGGISLALDLESGFMDRLLAAPISRSAIVVGRLAATAAIGIVSAVWFLVVGFVFGAHIEGGVVGVLVVVGLVPATAGAFGAIGASLALLSGKASVVQGVFPLVFAILFFSSAFFPRGLLLEPAASIADWNPMSFIAEGIRDPVVSGVSAEPLLKALGGIATVALIGISLSAAGLRARLRAS
jgi:ABC-2 type transport system permease protein